MKKVLLVALNSSWSQSNLALYYLREMLTGLSYQPVICDFTLKDNLGDVLYALYQHNPQVVCLSAYIWNREYLQKLIPELKKLLPQAALVVGGPEAVNLEPCLGVNDFSILGSGEAAFRELAESDFVKHHSSSTTTIQEDTAQASPRYTCNSSLDLKDIPFPYHPYDKERLQGKLVYYECYRGCPYGCVYCLSANDFRKELRFDHTSEEQLAKLYAELDALVALEPKTIKFIDRSFNIFPVLAHKIWAYFIASPYPCEVHFEIYPDLLSESDFLLLETAPEGRIRFEIGIQTTNDTIAHNSGRKTAWEQSKQALLQLKQRCRMRIHADLLAGLPGEDFASVLKSINELCACLPDAVQLGTLKILPDTPMLDIAKAKGYLWLNDPPYQCLASDSLSYTEMCTLESLARILNLYWNKEEYAPQWQQMLTRHKATDVLFALKAKHEELGYELHSLSKGKREAVMAEIYKQHGD